LVYCGQYAMYADSVGHIRNIVDSKMQRNLHKKVASSPALDCPQSKTEHPQSEISATPTHDSHLYLFSFFACWARYATQ